MILDERIATFVEWCAEFQLRVVAALDAGFVVAPESSAQEVPPPMPPMTASPANPAAPEDEAVLFDSTRLAMSLQRRTKPELARLRAQLEQFQSQLRAAPGFADFVAQLDQQIAELPLHVQLRPPPTRFERARGKDTSVSAPVRAWLEVSLARPVTDALAKLDAAANEALNAARDELDRLDKVTDYYVLAVQRHGSELDERHRVGEFAAAGNDRAQALLASYHEARRHDATRMQAMCLREVSAAIERAMAPLRSHRATELQRQLRLLKHRELVRRAPPSWWRGTRDAVAGKWASVQPWLRELRLDVRRILSDHRVDAVEERWSEILRPRGGPGSAWGATLPPGYSRLFTAVPFELADVYQERIELERECHQAIEAWLGGDPRSLVVEGDRGSGKRTLLNQVLPTVRQRAQVHWIRLSQSLRNEASVVESVARALELDPSLRGFEALATALQLGQRRPIIVVENAERIFQRTPAGVARMRDFLELVARTAPRVLWILVMAAPAAHLLDTVLDLQRRVTDRVRLGPLTPAAIRTLLLARHELSGHELEFERVSPRPLERLHRPLLTARALADPRTAYFARLAALSHGNPRQALYYWQSSLHTKAAGQPIHVRALPPAHRPLLEQVALSQRILLALLVQHGSLSVDELASITLESVGTTEGDLHVLRARGFAMSREAGQWTLGPVVAHPLTLELRAQNLI